MMRSKPSSSMQKTYDECYLMCSTAVYFEGQNNEAEALRSWRSALETIYYHNAYRVPANYNPKSETEKALQESLRQLELQCKERVDLLEALQESRKESEENPEENKDSKQQTPSLSSFSSRQPKLEKGKRPSNGVGGTNSSTPGWIGDGTIPAVDYMDLSKPPPLPVRPAVASKLSAPAVSAGTSMPPPRPLSLERKISSEAARQKASPSPVPGSSPIVKEPSRGSSPERRKIMLTTLRQKKDSKKPKPKSPSSRTTRPAASKAAGLAWGTTGQGFSGDGSSANPRNSTSSDSELRKDKEKPKSRPNEETSRQRERKPVPASDYILSSNWREPQYPDQIQSSAPPAYSPQPTAGNLDAAAAAAALAPAPTIDPTFKPPVSRQTKPLIPSKYPVYRKEYLSNPHPSGKPVGIMPMNRSASATQTPTLSAAENESQSPKKSMPKSQSTPRKLNSAVENTESTSSASGDEPTRTQRSGANLARGTAAGRKPKAAVPPKPRVTPPSSDQDSAGDSASETEGDKSFRDIIKKLPKGIDVNAARQILNDIVVRGDVVHWDDIAGLEPAKKALKEAVVYPFLRPDLFMGLREPARGMLLFGPPGTGKTMLARAVATESKSTFFSVSASSLTSKWHGESEKLVRALFGLAKALAPSIIFVDEIDSLLSTRSSGSEHEASRRSKTEFLIQWSDLQRAAAGREQDTRKDGGDPSRVLVLAATNLPWDIDEAARRRFVRRQYIPLPENHVRGQQIRRLLSHQKHEMTDEDIEVLVRVTEGFSGSDITALAKDAAMGPLRNLGEALLHTPMDQIRPIRFEDFEASLFTIRPSVGKEGLKRYEDWAKEYGERGG
ncbi:P-loop containing nucleoside triphosphate hydrolase protein [Talaromyces proteolyticus]|uniref:P-loop containing nucleoside triphosphate hydrolase protein n=1 Tax=Talaromyces proteolyticus TaxID=1131652 RepID=A0AAD4Q3F9_9EURO|nr:P-loop containing nucleoside triphosphate hydrolase protein [Talaromyces proteolyticus]KAH8701707.1 P-loop containing nucleoside triphosphate hydrolase protein [Talaromyces proteolyticus]